MALQLVEKGTLVDLPVFDFFSKNSGPQRIFEHAKIIFKETGTTPSYKRRYHGGVVGRNRECSVIYYSDETLVMSDGFFSDRGKIFGMPVADIESYELPEEQAYRRIK